MSAHAAIRRTDGDRNPTLSDDQVQRARKVVAGLATDADDLRLLLDALGIGASRAAR